MCRPLPTCYMTLPPPFACGRCACSVQRDEALGELSVCFADLDAMQVRSLGVMHLAMPTHRMHAADG